MTQVRVDAYRQVRLGGLGVDSVSKMIVPERRAWFNENSDSHRALIQDREYLSDALHEIIGSANIDDSERKKIVRIRRDLFNQEWHRALDGIQKLNGQRSAVGWILGTHLDRLRDIVDSATHFENEFDAWLDRERRVLAASVRNNEFLRGVALSSPSLVPSIHRYAEHIASGKADKKDRKTERSLLSYVLRASVKTSPFSTLGLIGLVGSGAGAAAKSEAPLVASKWSAYPLARVFNALSADPGLLDSFHVRRSPYVRESDYGLEVERTRWSFKDIDSGDDYAACVESVVTINQRSIAEAIEELLDENMTFGQLIEALSSDTGLDPERSRDLAAQLLRLGFLDIPALVCHPHDFEGLSGTVDLLQRTAPEIASALTEYVTTAAEFSSVTDPDERIQQINSLRSFVETAYEETGINGALPRSVVYEDALIPHDSLTVAGVEPDALADPALKILIDLQDDANLKNALMTGYFLHRWGQSGVSHDVSGFLSGFQTSLLDSFDGYDISQIDDDELADDPWLRWGEAWRWVQGRRRLAGVFSEHALTEGTYGPDRFPDGGDEVDVTGDIMRIADELPLNVPTFRHLNMLVQQDGKGGWVLNDSFGGIGFPISRFSHLVTDPRTYTADVEQTAGDVGVVLAEVTGGALFTNLNAHDPLVATEIVVPGDPLGTRSEQSITLAQLTVQYDAEQGRTVLLLDDGRIVHPIYPGYLVPAATPRHHQVLTLFGPTGNFSRKPIDNVEDRPTAGTVLRSPRIRIGTVVVARARVIVPAVDLPGVSPLTAHGYAEWAEFWWSAGLPTDSFVRILDDSGDRNKPRYHDATSVLCFSILFNALRGAETATYVEVSEALPLPGEGIASYAGTDRASESMVGISILGRTYENNSA